MKVYMLFFRIFLVVLVLALLNIYAGINIAQLWPMATRHVPTFLVVILMLFILQLAGPFGDRLLFPKINNAKFRVLILSINWASYLTFGVLSCLVVYCMVAEIAELAHHLMFPQAGFGAFHRHLLSVLVLLTAGTTGVGVLQAVAGPRVRRVDVPLTGLPASFDGFKMAQISDLHVGPTIGRKFVERIVRLTNGLQPDLIALTGDFADGTVADTAAAMQSLRHLTAPEGKFFITGNHEYYWDAAAWIAEHQRLGARTLLNAHAVIRRGDDKIILAGVTDYSTLNLSPEHASDPARALDGAPEGCLKILLAHQPASYLKAQEAGFALQLSGHTHGGQYFPFNLLIPFFQRYYKGLNRYKDMWIYVNRGTGYWGPPLRTFVGGEIALITLRSAD